MRRLSAAERDPERDRLWMEIALAEARAAAAEGEVPVGAVLVSAAGAPVARAHNRREADQDPLAHAEVLAIRAAARALGNWRLEGATLYVTLEPCAMCAGAIVLARIARLVYGAADPKAGFCGSLDDLVRDPRLNHRVEVEAGVEAESSRALLRDFFAGLRKRRGERPANELFEMSE
jgi:tRNA(adenine34) deaminase